MKLKNLKGTGIALVTPFNEDLSIDYFSLEKIINHVISGGADFIVVLGTTGEASVLSHQEKLDVIAFVRDKVAGRVPLILGYGGISTARMIEDFSLFDFGGYSALLIVTPFYVKPTQAGLIAHYNALADASPLPVILYNVPGRTGVNMETATTLILSEHPNIIGIKEASGKLFQIEDVLMRKKDDFLLFSGDDALTYHLMNVGADGVISVIGNALPIETSAVVSCMKDGGECLAKDTHLALKVITKSLFTDGNPAGIKYLLSKLGLCNNILRLPLVPVGKETEEAINCELAILKG